MKNELVVDRGKVIAAAKKCPEFRKVAETLWPGIMDYIPLLSTGLLILESTGLNFVVGRNGDNTILWTTMHLEVDVKYDGDKTLIRFKEAGV